VGVAGVVGACVFLQTAYNEERANMGFDRWYLVLEEPPRRDRRRFPSFFTSEYECPMYGFATERNATRTML
jgi:hypothetical protein